MKLFDIPKFASTLGLLCFIISAGFSQQKFNMDQLNDPKKYGPEIAEALNSIEVYEYEKQQANCIYLKNGFREAKFVNEKEWLNIQDTVEAYRIDIVYSKYPIRNGTYYEIYPLLLNRIQSVLNMDPTLNNASLSWNKVLQTHCLNDNQVNTLFHGVVVWFKTATQLELEEKAEEETQLNPADNKLNRVNTERGEAQSEQSTFEDLIETVDHLLSIPGLPDSVKNSVATQTLDQKILTLKNYLEEEIASEPEHDLSTAEPEEITEFQSEVDYFLSRYSVTDSVVHKVFNRHPEWKNMLVINDWTGSMYGYGAQVLDWHLKNFEKSGIISITLFNDGDNNSNKPIGSTGGIYFEEADNVPQLVDLFNLVMLKGGGGDAPENDIEAILAAMDEFEHFTEIVLIGDNNACVRDIELANRIGKPVRVILCGYNEKNGVNPHYAYLAKVTGGGIYTIEDDLEDLKLEIGESGKIQSFSEKRFKIQKNACTNTDFLISMEKTYELKEALRNKKKVRKVDASELDLEKIPSGLFKIQKLSHLNLSHNQLTKVHAKIGRLAYLHTLDLSFNKLTDLPWEFGALRFLINLDMSNNSLDSIPKSIAGNKSLQSLNLSHNRISDVWLTNLTRLVELDLSHNQIVELPKSFTKLKQLRKLNISNNSLSVIPTYLSNLRKLQHLDLSNNGITKMPKDLKRFTRIKFLNLEGNSFSEEEENRIKKELPFTQVLF